MKDERKGFTRIALALGIVGVLGAAALWRSRSASSGSDSTSRIEGQAVRRGPLTISVVERGNLKSADSIVLKNEIEGQTTILYLIAEGTLVKAGELLCELDTSELVERRVAQKIAVESAEASFVNAKQTHEIQESQNQSDIAKAERELDFAKVDLAKYIDGDWPQFKQAADEAILLAKVELARATQDRQWSERLQAKGFLEMTQLDADKLAEKRAEIQQAQTTRELELLEKYEFPRQKKLLEADVEEAGRELDRTKLQATARIVDFESDVRSSESRLALEREKFEKLDSQIAKSKITAPVDGMVVYAQQQGSRWGGGEPLREGTQVRERQEIINIPQTEGMIAEASLHETVLEKVKEGMRCKITVGALPDSPSFEGRVRFKAVLPDQNSWYANPDLRVYRTEIEIDDPEPRMRPGMSCSLEVMVEEIPDTLYVPLQSIYLDAGNPVCFVASGKSPEVRAVQVGQNNGKWAEIKSGLKEGEMVLLAQPAGFSLKPANVEERRVAPLEGEGPPKPRGGDGDERGSPGAGGPRAGKDGDGGRRERKS